jgi:hypothetical protein
VSVPTVPDRPLTVPKGPVTATVPTVPSPPIGGTVEEGTVSRVHSTVPRLTVPVAASLKGAPMSNVDDSIQARIERVKHQRETRRQRRAEFDEARQGGLVARKRRKLQLRPLPDEGGDAA